MRIQEEIPLPPSPLATFERDYAAAVVHLAWDRRRGGEGRADERTLIFAFVELLPTEIPPPNDDYDPRDPRCSERLGSGSDHTVYVRHAVVHARDALAWYLDCRRGVAVLPDERGRFPAPGDPGAKLLRLADLGEEPPWPTLICAADDSDAIPFAPEWAECPRVHHLVPAGEFNLDGLWSRSEQERALAWLSDHLHFSLEDYPEYWGSVHLVAPNPVFRRIHAGHQKRTPPASSVALRFEPRAGRSVEGLTLVYRGAGSSGTMYEHTTLVRSPLVRMSFGHQARPFQTDVLDSQRGMLNNSSFLSVFVESVTMNVHVGGMLDVNGPTPQLTYTVARSGPPLLKREKETAKIASAKVRLAEGSRQRRQRAAAKKSHQRWFRGQQEEAQDVLRGLLHAAQREVLIVDPYFGPTELWAFTLAVGREDIPVRILSSADVLKEPADHEGPGTEKGELLRDQLRHVRSQPHMNPFEIKVMIGGRPAVHDRFLLVDDRIWLLGSSLNEFGSRGTMMVSLPDPDPVREQLMKAWSDAIGLDAWIERRRENRGGEEAT